MADQPLHFPRRVSAHPARRDGITERLTQVAIILAALVIEIAFIRYTPPPAAALDPATEIAIGP